MQVAKISAEKAQEIRGMYYDSAGKINPVQDYYGNWIITLEEAVVLDPSDYEVIEWVPPVYPEDE
jgi:hypothetical protein